jgi:hypothetical protein
MAAKKSKTGKGRSGKGTGRKPSPPAVRAALVSTQNTIAGCSASVLGSQSASQQLAGLHCVALTFGAAGVCTWGCDATLA